MDKIGRNDPCPCGSGKKYKRCCLDQNANPVGFTSDDRRLALEKLDRFVETELGAQDDEAWESFFEIWADQLEELNDEETQISEDFYDAWFLWDCALADGGRVVDRFLEIGPLLSLGERQYLTLMRETTVRLYEVVDLSPGESVTLVELPSGARTRVREKSASRSLCRGALLAARIIGRGASGQPEIEFGLLSIPELVRDQVLSQVSKQHENYRREYPEATDLELLKAAAPVLHDVWISALLDPPIPRLQNTDGEDLLATRVRFEVADPAQVQAAFDAARGLEREEDGKPVWLWSGGNLKGKPVILGRLVLEEDALELECNSAERAERGRTMIETLAAGVVRHRSTVHQNVVMDIRERLRSRRRESTAADSGGRPALPGEAVPREAQEALTLDAQARHYREWLDLPIPALNDRTPREAAKDPALRPKLAKLIRRLEGAYQGCLQADKPAYDPSWMWGELGLEDRSRPMHPPLLAHERMASLVPGLGELCRTVAENARRQPGFKDASSILTRADIRRNLDIQRFLRHREADQHNQASAPGEQVIPSLEPHIYLMTNLELHRRKTFWVDESLAYMLAKTELDLPGDELRAPFPCFALVFSDRYTLSLAERLLARDRQCPIAGYYLKAATIYVIEERLESGRGLGVVFALDTLGADPPHLAEYDVPLTEKTQIKGFLDGLAPRLIAESEIPDANPLRALFHLVFSSILYATSAGVAPEVRHSPGAGGGKGSRRGAGEPPIFSSESVFFLPGSIEISRVREFEELERVSSGRRILHRFMVRGHWRRAAAGWKDQRLRWIEPYWKGPDIGAVIERAYRLKP